MTKRHSHVHVNQFSLDLKYPKITLPAEVAKQLRTESQVATARHGEDSDHEQEHGSGHTEQSNHQHERAHPQDQGQEIQPEAQPLDVVQTYLTSMAEFHNNLMGMQEEVMRAYLFAQQQDAHIEPQEGESGFIADADLAPISSQRIDRLRSI